MDFKEMLKEGAEAAKDLAGDAKELAEDLVDKAGDAIDSVIGEGRPTFAKRAAAMYAMMGEAGILATFEKYYHEDVVMHEATGEVREGKAANRAFLEQWQASIEEMHGGGVTAITANEAEKVTMVETWADVTFKDGNRVKLEEVAVQRWQGDQIIHERFYYNMPS